MKKYLNKMGVHYSLLILLGLVVLFGSTNVSAAPDFKKNYDYYETICSKRSTYELNKTVCDQFEKYKYEGDDSALRKIDNSMKDSNLDADKLGKLLQKSETLIARKEEQVAKNKKLMEKSNSKIAQIEAQVSSRVAAMQEINNENQTIDFLFGAKSLGEFLTRMDGLEILNDSNFTMIKKLEDTKSNILQAQKYLNEDLAKLKRRKKTQNKMLREFIRKESKLYDQLNNGKAIGSVYNDGLDKVDWKKWTDKNKGWGMPIKHGVVTATSWYYPASFGGGWHPGSDLAAPLRTPIMAPADGAVLATAQTGSGYGKHVVTIHKKGDYVYTIIYAHMMGWSNANTVKRGSPVGYIGLTGSTTGPHVHVEIIRHNTADVQAVISEFKKHHDYWFGLGYSSTGDCNKVCRLKTHNVLNKSLNQTW